MFLIRFIFLNLIVLATTLAGTPEIPRTRQVFQSGCEYDYPPFCMVDNQGQATGFSVELLRAALASINCDVEYRVGNWQELKQLLEVGSLDVLPLVGRTPERESIYDFTFPYLSLHGAIVVREDTQGVSKLTDLEHRRVAVMAGDNAQEYVHRVGLDADIIATPTFEVALRGLSDGLHDAVVIQRLLATRLIRDKNIQNLKIIQTPLEDLRQDFCFAVPEGDHATLSRINEGLALVIADGTLNRLQRKWFGSLELPSNRRVILGTEGDFPPFAFRDEQGKASGYNVELVEALAEFLQLDIEIRLDSWQRIRQDLDAGEIDLVVGMYYSEPREQIYDFSPPFAVMHHGIFARADSPALTTESDLTGRDIIVMEGDIMHDYVLEQGISIAPVLVNSIPEALTLLAQGKHDYALTALYPSLRWIRENGDTRLSKVGPLLNPVDYCFAARRGEMRLLNRIQEGMRSLDETGVLRKLDDKWLGILKPVGIPAGTVLKYLGLAGFLFLLVVILALVWSRTLKHKITERTQELSESRRILAQSEQKYRLLADFTHDWEFWIGPEGNYIYSSPACERITGHPPQDFIDQPGLLLDLVLPEFVDQVKNHFSVVHSPHNTFSHIEFPIRHLSGELRWIEHYCMPVFDDQKNYAGRRGNHRDISARVEREKILAETSNLRELLLDIITHDLANPAGVILGLADYARETLPQSNLIDEIYTSSNRLLSVLKHTTTLGQATFGESIPTEPLNLFSLVEELLPEFNATCIARGIDLVNSISPDLVIQANPLLSEVFRNYISNALKYATEGKRITVEAVLEKAAVKISVNDLGPTIPADKREVIFDRLAQLNREKNRGRGLGLAIVKRIALAHGGQVWVEPNTPQGNRFCLRIPSTPGVRIAHEQEHEHKESSSGTV